MGVERGTYVYVRFDPRSGSAHELVRRAVSGRGRLVPTSGLVGAGVVGSLALFASASEATWTVLDLAAAAARPGHVLALRMVVGRERAADRRPAAVSARCRRASRLLDSFPDARVLVTGAAAGVVDAALPAGVEMVHRRAADAGLGPTDRVYEIRPTHRPGQEGGAGGPGGGQGGRSSLRWARRAVPAALVGRDEHLRALTDAWQAACRGEQRAVALVGAAGTGKTALAAELALAADADGALVLYGRWDRTAATPASGVRELLAAFGDDGASGRDSAGFGTGTPELQALDLCRALEARLDRSAGHRPVLLVLDDVQWAEPASQVVVDHLVHAVRPSRWMVLVTSGEVSNDRGGVDLPEWWGRLDRVEVGALGRADVARLVEQRGGWSPAPDSSVVGWLTVTTGGNPRSLVERFLALEERGRGEGDRSARP